MKQELKGLGCGVEVFEALNFSGGVRPLEVSPDYIVYIAIPPLTSKSKSFKNLEQEILYVKSLSLENSSKTLFVFPYLHEKSLQESVSSLVNTTLSDRNLFFGIIFLGDLVASKSDDFSYFLLNDILKRLKNRKSINFLPSSFVFNPISAKTAAQFIVRSLFSLKAYGNVSALLGKPISLRNVLGVLRKVDPQISSSFNAREVRFSRAYAGLKAYVDEDTKKLLVETYLLIPSRRGESLGRKIRQTKANFSENLKSKKENLLENATSKKIWKKVFLICLLLLILPLLSVILSFIFLVSAKKTYTENLIEASVVLLKAAEASAKASAAYSEALSKTPLLGTYYTSLWRASGFLEKMSLAGTSIIKLTEATSSLYETVTGTPNSLDPEAAASEVKLGLGILYENLGFLEPEVVRGDLVLQTIVKLVLEKDNIASVREKVGLLSEASGELPKILGSNKPKTYLVLFQNSDKIRPTGGEIDAFALLTFSGGRVITTEVYDTSYADTNLNGEVAAPKPIQKYFGQKTWFLKDANWDADFSIAAEQAEWFIDKELDVVVDGVVALDSEFLRGILREMGGFEAANLRITDRNFYEAIAASYKNYPRESSGDTFRELSDEILKTLFNLKNTEQRFRIAKRLKDSLEKKDIQIFLHEPKLQDLVSGLGWDGSLRGPECGEGCYKDLAALVEASNDIGGRRIVREAQLLVSIEEGVVKRHLAIFIQNPTDKIYSSYFRVYAAGESGFSPVELTTGNTSSKIYPEVYGIRGLKEAGVFVQLQPNETKAINFSWESKLSEEFRENRQYLLLIRKQAGIPSYALEIKLNFPGDIAGGTTNVSSLTEDGGSIYNTVLSKDINLKIFLKNNE